MPSKWMGRATGKIEKHDAEEVDQAWQRKAERNLCQQGGQARAMDREGKLG